MPFTELLEGGEIGGQFKSIEGITAAFESAGVDLNQPIVCSCGSGATAAILALGMYMVSGRIAAIYDGSWMEWASVPGNPIVPFPDSIKSE